MARTMYPLIIGTIILFCGTALAKTSLVQRDTDEDGKIDQVAHFDKKGRLIRLEIDGNADGIMDRFQYYEGDVIKEVERDRNYDRQIDTWDFFEQGKRIRHERAATDTGRLEQIIVFDAQERPLEIKRDTTLDGRFDILILFKNGNPSYEEKDTNFDGRKDIFIHFDTNGFAE